MSTSSGTVIFLGAGASKPMGLPLTRDILPRILSEIEKRSLFGGDVDAINRLDRMLTATVFPGLASWRQCVGSNATWFEQLPAITDVLSLIDHLIQAGNAAALECGLTELVECRRLFERAIFEILGAGVSDAKGGPQEPPEMIKKSMDAAAELVPSLFHTTSSVAKEFAVWLRQLMGDQSEKGQLPLTVITSNYDLVVESELYSNYAYSAIWKHFDFGTAFRDPDSGTLHPRPERPSLRFLKLHGSLNWLRCDLCDHVYMNPNGPIAYLAFKSKYQDGLDFASTCHCGFTPLRHIMIAPSTVRDVHDANLMEIWKAAFEALRAADKWLIIGYSLPSEDVAIRSMFLRAWHARGYSSKPAIRVIQPPPVQGAASGDQPATMSRTEVNYRLAFGSEFLSYEPIGIEKLIQLASSTAASASADEKIG